VSGQSEVKSSLENQSASKLQHFKTPLGFDLLLDPRDYFSRLLMRDGVFEAPESDLISRLVRQDDTCIDAGSHVGYYTCLLARLVGKKGHVYAFDANPEACEAANRNLSLNGLNWAEVIHAALADHEGSLPFYVSSDDQTGLSSLGSIPNFKKILHVPCSRLDAFLDNRGVEHIRLLKIDVEGSEEMVLSGLGRFLTEHLTDFILLELYDERLRGLNTSTEKVKGIFQKAGYRAWTYENPSGWLMASQVQSRGDCNYLFVSPTVHEPVPSFTLAPVLAQTQVTLSRESETLHAREQEAQGLKREVESLQQESKRLQEETVHLQERLFAIENSTGWRALNVYRKFRRYLAFGKESKP
jgi:FkbM family methyltransferase